MLQSQSSQAYRSSQRLGAGARHTEARALLEAARRMSDARDSGGTNMDGYRSALRLNWRLWTIIQSDIVSDSNPLPDDIKANIMSLSVFIDRHTVGALAEPEGRKLDVLIDINRNIASGLMATPAEAEPAVPAASSDAGAGSAIIA